MGVGARVRIGRKKQMQRSSKLKKTHATMNCCMGEFPVWGSLHSWGQIMGAILYIHTSPLLLERNHLRGTSCWWDEGRSSCLAPSGKLRPFHRWQYFPVFLLRLIRCTCGFGRSAKSRGSQGGCLHCTVPIRVFCTIRCMFSMVTVGQIKHAQKLWQDWWPPKTNLGKFMGEGKKKKFVLSICTNPMSWRSD